MAGRKRFPVNTHLAAGVTREQVVEFITNEGVRPRAWELVRNRELVDYAFKVGDDVGLVGFMDEESSDVVRTKIEALPLVAEGFVDVEIAPVSAIARFD